MDRKERLALVFKYLRNNDLIKTQKDLADKMNTTPQNVSSALRGMPSVLTDKFFMRLNDSFFNLFSLDWLLRGEGQMLINNGDKKAAACLLEGATSYGGAAISGHPSGVPLYDAEPAQCGELTSFAEAFAANKANGEIVLPYMEAKKGDIFITTRGRSMVDYEHPELSIPEGAIVLIREWRESYIAWGELYCVITRSGYAVKRLMPGADAEHVSCVSADTLHYPPYEVSLTDIVGLGRVIGILTYKTV